MESTKRRYRKEEFARRGEKLVESKVRPILTAADADKFVAKLRAKAARIALAPKIYTRRDDLEVGLRSAAFGNYLIFFRIVDDGIDVSRVVHGARNLPRLFEP